MRLDGGRNSDLDNARDIGRTNTEPQETAWLHRYGAVRRVGPANPAVVSLAQTDEFKRPVTNRAKPVFESILPAGIYQKYMEFEKGLIH